MYRSEETPVPDLPETAAVAAMIDHSLLRPELTVDEVREGCALAASVPNRKSGA
jgi:deoxyribose-phosphate aldolase